MKTYSFKVLFVFLFIIAHGIAQGSNNSLQTHRIFESQTTTINSFITDNYGFLLIAANNGLYIYSPGNSRNIGKNTRIDGKECFALAETTSSDILVGVENGLAVYNRISSNVTFYPIPEKNTHIVQIVTKSANEYFILTQSGNIYVFSYNDKSLTKLNLPKKSYTQVYRMVSDLLFLVTADGSILQYNFVENTTKETGSFEISTNRNNLEVCAYNNEIIIGNGDKLLLYNTKNQQIRTIYTQFDILSCVAGDDQLYILSDSAVFTFNPENDKPVLLYTLPDNVASQKNKISAAYTHGELLIASGNRIFGGSVSSEITVEPVIASIYINGKQLKPLDNSTPYFFIDSRVEQLNALNFKTPDTDIGISLFYPCYSGKKYGIAYRFAKNKHWIYLQGLSPHILLRNFQAGDYTLEFATTYNNELNKKYIRKLELSVKGNLLKAHTILAILLFVLIVIISVYFYVKIKYFNTQRKQLEDIVQKRTAELLKRNGEIENQNIEIVQQNDEIKKQHDEIVHQHDKIQQQKKELEKHRLNLEDMVQKRTLDLQNAKQKAEESDKLKTSFLANMSHEVRTPLNAIIGFSSMHDNIDLGDQQREEFIKLIYTNSENLLNLFEDIIDISKLESGAFEINYSNFSIEHFFTDLYTSANDLRNNDRKINIDFIWNKKAENTGIEMYSDKQRLMQIMLNLINNAFKYTEKGSVEIGFEISENYRNELQVPQKIKNAVFQNKFITFYVKDTGIGISPNNHNIIFEHFRKIEGDIKKLYRGTGIGLAIAQKIIEQIGGKIWVESELGKGACFNFVIPYYKYIEQDKKHISQKSIKDKVILVGEDEKINIMYIKQVLENKHALLHIEDSCKQTIQMFDKLHSKGDVHLVLLDILLPDGDGYQILEYIKQRDEHIPVVAQTAFAMQSELAKMKEAGFDDVITKPYTQEKLINAVLQNIL